MRSVIENLAKKYFALLILLGGVSGLMFSKVGQSLTFLVMPSLFVLMFFTVLKVDLSKLLHSVKKPLPLIAAAIISYIIIPFVLYFIAYLFGFSELQKLSVMFSALAPTILSAPYFVSIMRGDVEFSFVISVVLTLLAPFVIPFELYVVFEKSINFPFFEIFSSILLLIVIPFILLLVLKRYFPTVIKTSKEFESTITSIMFFIFTWAVISVNADKILGATSYIYAVILLAIVQEFGFYILLRYLGRIFLSEQMSKAFAFSIAVKNTVLTAGVAMLYSDDVALMSGIVVLIHVPMFAWVLHKKNIKG